MTKGKSLGERLKLLRGTRTQDEVSKLVGLSRARYSHYENNRVEPDTDILKRLAEFYNVSIDYLLDNEHGEKNNKQLIKDEKDIAKRLKQFEAELENSDGLAFDGEPMSEEAKESLLESMELLFKQTQRINKKFTPKKYREDE